MRPRNGVNGKEGVPYFDAFWFHDLSTPAGGSGRWWERDRESPLLDGALWAREKEVGQSGHQRVDFVSTFRKEVALSAILDYSAREVVSDFREIPSAVQSPHALLLALGPGREDPIQPGAKAEAVVAE